MSRMKHGFALPLNETFETPRFRRGALSTRSIIGFSRSPSELQAEVDHLLGVVAGDAGVVAGEDAGGDLGRIHPPVT